MGTIKPVLGTLNFTAASTASTTMSDDVYGPYFSLAFHPASNFTGTATIQVSADGVLWNNFKNAYGQTITCASGSTAEAINIPAPFIRAIAPSQGSITSISVMATRQPY